MPDVIMPRLSDSMTEGTIARWLKSDGDEVTRGEEIVEIETDKATIGYESDFDGALIIREPEGAVVPVGRVIAAVGEAVPSAGGGGSPPGEAVGVPADEPVGMPVDEPVAVPAVAATATPSGDGGAVNGRAKASPLARRVAQRLGVELAAVTGTGPQGRIVKSDVIAAFDAGAASTAPARAAADPPEPLQVPEPAVGAREGADVIELTRTQSLIARRMAQSRAAVPEFALEVDVDMSAAVRMRAELKALADPAPSLNDLIVKACALALRRHPRANGSFAEDRFIIHPRVNVAIAVAVEGSLLTPVIPDADTKSLGAIAQDARGLIERARAGRIAPAELEGATFTVSNLGMFGIDRFEGIINAPQSAILCVGAVRDRVVAEDGQAVVRPMSTLTLAADHRILYGADAAAFLTEIRRLLEQPLAMVL